ncbi:MAG: YbaN family protein [Carnobacterium sp.]|uniref:YbaN family protein n=1 Tax=Carnobacterium sp. TaxID=48221 RepID=UPI003C74FA24
MKKIKKIILISVGCLSFALGLIGSFLPLLPTTPFLLLSLYCFTQSSEKFNQWLKSTKIYQEYVGEYLKYRSFTFEKKIKMLISIYIMVGISIYFIPLLLVKGMLIFMLISQTVILLFFIKTREKETIEKKYETKMNEIK